MNECHLKPSLTDLIKNFTEEQINQFQANIPFLYPLKTSEREHWPEIG